MQIISSPKTLNAILESGFIQNILFQGASYSTQFDPNKSLDTVVVYLELFRINLELIREMKAAGKKVVLYHMGDELANKNISAYTACDLIIRNYYFPDIHNLPELTEKILWAPNGCKTGVGPREPDTLQKVAARQYLSCFLGWLSNSASFNGERNLFSEAISAWLSAHKRRTKNFIQWLKYYLSLSEDYLSFTEVAPFCEESLHLLSSNGFSNGYNVGLYSATMEDSIFAPCPAGNSPETIRLYDALECGCIPISLEHEFLISKDALGELGPPPLITLSSWSEFPEFLSRMRQKMLINPDAIQIMQDECITWWKAYKKHISKKIVCRIESLN